MIRFADSFVARWLKALVANDVLIWEPSNCLTASLASHRFPSNQPVPVPGISKSHPSALPNPGSWFQSISSLRNSVFYLDESLTIRPAQAFRVPSDTPPPQSFSCSGKFLVSSKQYIPPHFDSCIEKIINLCNQIQSSSSRNLTLSTHCL